MDFRRLRSTRALSVSQPEYVCYRATDQRDVPLARFLIAVEQPTTSQLGPDDAERVDAGISADCPRRGGVHDDRLLNEDPCLSVHRW
jgi:hypothetical protein